MKLLGSVGKPKAEVQQLIQRVLADPKIAKQGPLERKARERNGEMA